MASKLFFVEGIGDITVFKRRKSRRLNLRILNGNIRVSQPTWLPYATGLQFAIKNRHWIDKQIAVAPKISLENNTQIGKLHILEYQPSDKLRSRLSTGKITIYIPAHLHINKPEVQLLVKKAIKRALKVESKQLLPSRVSAFATKYNYNFNLLKFKSMRTRWGSCNNQKVVTLNIFLMMLPYSLIDYVILHELAHTKHLNHSKDFWNEVANVMPDYKQRRKALKDIQHNVLPLN